MAIDLNDEYEFISPFDLVEGETVVLIFDFNVTVTVIPWDIIIHKPDVQITLSIRQGDFQ
jgi:hypothetical protein